MLLAMLLCVCTGTLSASGNMSADTLSAAAAKEYASGNYGRAAELYDSAANKGGVSPELLYNQGNACVKTHDYGRAALCYGRAKKLDPSSTEINNNLKYVAQYVDAQNRADLKGKPANVSPEEPWFFRAVYNWYAVDHSSDFWAVWAAATFVLLIAAIALYIFCQGVALRKAGFFGAIALTVFTVVFLSFAFAAASASQAHDTAVIMQSKVELLADPSDNAKKTTTYLNRGTVVEILKTDDTAGDKPEWYDVRLNSECSGWIKAENIEII